MSMSTIAKAAILAFTVAAAAPVLADGPADAAGQQVRVLLNHSPALHADLLQVEVEGQTVYIRGIVDSQVEATEIDSVISALPGARIVNATVVADLGA